jgi:hypothetical protein
MRDCLVIWIFSASRRPEKKIARRSWVEIGEEFELFRGIWYELKAKLKKKLARQHLRLEQYSTNNS